MDERPTTFRCNECEIDAIDYNQESEIAGVCDLCFQDAAHSWLSLSPRQMRWAEMPNVVLEGVEAAFRSYIERLCQLIEEEQSC